MLRVKTKLGLSSINGVGLFADQFIPKGSTTWEYDPGFDPSYSEEEAVATAGALREEVEKAGGVYISSDLPRRMGSI